MNYYNLSTEKTLKLLDSTKNGLTEEKAQKRLLKYGKNKLAEGKKKSVVSRFIKELCDPMIIILIVSAIVSGITSFIEREFPSDVIIIIFVVLLNAILGVVQESKAEKAIEALHRMAKSTTKVIRNGQLTVVESEDLVIGDVIVLEAGDIVPADCRILECFTVKTEESALTGESFAVIKTADVIEKEKVPLADRKNCMYLGSTVVYGKCKAVITNVSMNTELGKIAGSLQSVAEENTPLQKKLNELSKILSIAVLGICMFIFVFTIVKNGNMEGRVLLDTRIVAISLAVAAIPEGLATVVTIVLSIGVTKMSRHNAVIRKLTAVETLGCAEVICSDKTGTLTQNKMTVTESFADDSTMLSLIMACCNDATVIKDGLKGEATECALLEYALKNGIDKPKTERDNERVAEMPFDSVRKMMSTVNRYNGKYIQFTKGAFDELIKKCAYYKQGDKVVSMTSEIRKKYEDVTKNMAKKALRILAGAYKTYDNIPNNLNENIFENQMIFVGVCGMIDPVRPEVKKAISECHKAGIKTIMITGDHKITATAIAEELGILTKKNIALTGAELDELSDEQFIKIIDKITVYARVQPEHKVRIVRTWQKIGKITAMTGDGVNDAPSMKMADIGIVMGITGTDVTKNVADMVLADDNFATIVYAVKEGRKIYDNIRKTIQFLLSSNLSEVLAIFLSTIIGFTVLKPTHLLWINLITDTFPAIGLGLEHTERGIMNRKPRPSKEGIFAGGMSFNVIYQGITVTALVLLSYIAGVYIDTGKFAFMNGNMTGMTMAFLTMNMAEIFHSVNMRSQTKSIFKVGKPNAFIILTVFISFLLTIGIIYIPFLRGLFILKGLSIKELVIAIIISFMIIPIVETVKMIQRVFIKKNTSGAV